ncbi:hypothetical protein [Fodinibius halophilus]|uniref:Uncharacterized protein n=1 Tax=Fodinibius halophilus TaxID=1736908 RepID=A0A6M1T3J7_9BACT|nr:hypothetical protein [Fodinibius halophilus]NGP87795.1 hypothetical protein [Fodinibius halophilus]
MPRSMEVRLRVTKKKNIVIANHPPAPPSVPIVSSITAIATRGIFSCSTNVCHRERSVAISLT